MLLSGNERMMRGRQIFSLKKDHVLKHMKEGMDIIPMKNGNENDFTVHGQHLFSKRFLRGMDSLVSNISLLAVEKTACLNQHNIVKLNNCDYITVTQAVSFQ